MRRLPPLLKELHKPGRKGLAVPRGGFEVRPAAELLPTDLLRHEPLSLPEVPEVEVVRHFVNLSNLNYGVDTGFYPLGSCTMKYNPKINEEVSAWFSDLHPYLPAKYVQPLLELLYTLQQDLLEVTGMDAITLEPAAGAHGELTAMLMAKAYLKDKGLHHKDIVIVPDSAHGTNPASAAMAGFQVITVQSNEEGLVDIDKLKAVLNDRVAVLMLTNPNTLGKFERDIMEMAKMVHDLGGLLYYDGANLNGILGWVRPGDMGFDFVHLNLHKTFSTPHGGGGPGSGPVAVKKELEPYLPKPVIVKDGETYKLETDRPKSIGKVRSFYGNILVALKALAYIKALGGAGLREAGALAVLNANYMRVKTEEFLPTAYPGLCKHEYVATAEGLKRQFGVRTLDIAKRLLDKGFHAPTVYFPLIVHEALMIEPTETETKENLDAFVEALREIVEEAQTNAELVKSAPHVTPVRRLDDTKATKQLKVRW
ncbi:aminomethyl-transferring glycine dehydrogenase subunit GcvPB [Coprothermobacteraceae bacterium]|nr:aminomethyl-transferring glycine dehydrogenase subunit GcvPB [Coprothermobacteraceae bacterium]